MLLNHTVKPILFSPHSLEAPQFSSLLTIHILFIHLEGEIQNCDLSVNTYEWKVNGFTLAVMQNQRTVVF